MGHIAVGVAGWDYPDWVGTVYPSGSARGFDRLAYLSRFVDVVEVNATFYRPVDPRLAASWVRRTANRSGLVFTAKAHRSWTHDRSGGVPRLTEALQGLAPLKEAGRLGALLIQFPQRFHAEPASFEYLQRILAPVREWSPVVEVRHRSWDRPETAEWLRERGAGWCVVDQPQVGVSSIGTVARVTAPVGYLRLHGRNVADWFREDAGRDRRYDYLYGADELASLASTARVLACAADRVFVVQNNHFRGQALANALQMKHLLTGRRPAAPGELCRAYPQLRGSVTTRQGDLF